MSLRDRGVSFPRLKSVFLGSANPGAACVFPGRPSGPVLKRATGNSAFDNLAMPGRCPPFRGLLRALKFTLVLGFVVGFLSSRGAAQSEAIVLLPVGGTESLREGPGSEAHGHVRGALEAVGFTVREEPELASRCGDDPACIAEGVPLAVMVSVWARQGQPEPSEVNVTLIEGSALHDGRAELNDGLEVASARAVALALAQRRGEGGGRLVIRGTPRGANVVVDGVRVGQLPEADVRVDDGVHTLSVSHAGFQSLRRRVQSEGGATVQVALEPEVSGGGEAGSGQPGLWRLIAGGALIAVGGAGVGIGVSDALAGDGCSGECRGPSPTGERFGAASGVVLGLGVAAVAAGVVLVVRGVQLRAQADGESAFVETSFRF